MMAFFVINMAFAVVSLVPATVLFHLDEVPAKLAWAIVFVVGNYIIASAIGFIYMAARVEMERKLAQFRVPCRP